MPSLSRRHREFAVAMLALAGVLLWDLAGFDLALARWFGGPQGFPLREHWLFAGVLHGGARALAWLVALALCLAVAWPFGWMRRLHWRERVQLAATPLLALLMIGSIKSLSATSCPWDLATFGRAARHLPHWPWHFGISDGGGGHCFPAGHAAAGYAFVSGWFVFRDGSPRLARRWLTAALVAGTVLGLAQQVRGAHFMSHTLWTAWLCWTCAALLDAAWRMAPRQRAVLEPVR